MKRRIGFGLIIALFVAGSILTLFYTRIFLPVGKLSGDDLVIDNVHFIYEASNFSYRPIKVGKTIARATANEVGIRDLIFPNWVKEIKGQSNREWILVSGLMQEVLFRNQNITSYDIRDVTIDNIKVMRLDAKTNPKQTNDLELIGVLKSSLTGKEIQIKNRIPKFELRVYSEQFKELYYYLNIIIEDDTVYLGDRDKFYKAGTKLSSWLQEV